jgi:nucleotide-binding universal stress UspA family protein
MEQAMGAIVCAIRGWPDSQPTVLEGIALAKRTGLPLHFLYVVNLDFLSRTSSSRTHTISEEMHQMGEFILLKAQSAASDQGVEATSDVRQGEVREEIVALCHEIDAQYLVMGRPRLEGEESIFSQELQAKFVERVSEETGAEVILTESAES